jgi:uncharacterized iron-regulated membrane protein
MRTLGRRRHRLGGIATLVVILAGLLAVIAAPATALAATLAGTRVSASTLAAPLGTGPPSSSAAGRQPENASTYDKHAAGVPVATEGGVDITAQLQAHVDAAAAEADAQGLTEAQAAAAARYPGLAAAFRGSNIDAIAKASVAEDPALQGISITPRFVAGPDFYDATSGSSWWDITTQGQWAAHVAQYGPGGTLLPYP